MFLNFTVQNLVYITWKTYLLFRLSLQKKKVYIFYIDLFFSASSLGWPSWVSQRHCPPHRHALCPGSLTWMKSVSGSLALKFEVGGVQSVVNRRTTGWRSVTYSFSQLPARMPSSGFIRQLCFQCSIISLFATRLPRVPHSPQFNATQLSLLVCLYPEHLFKSLSLRVTDLFCLFPPSTVTGTICNIRNNSYHIKTRKHLAVTK